MRKLDDVLKEARASGNKAALFLAGVAKAILARETGAFDVVVAAMDDFIYWAVKIKKAAQRELPKRKRKVS